MFINTPTDRRRLGWLFAGWAILRFLLPTAAVAQQAGSGADKAASSSHRLLFVRTTQGSTAGLPIHWGPQSAILLRPSGAMDFVEQAEIEEHRVLKAIFRPETVVESRRELMKSLGEGFESTVSGHYIIAAPKGTADRWRRRFDILYSGFMRYFSLRGWQLQTPDFPLRVIVFPSRHEFVTYAKQQGATLPSGSVGAYYPRSNVCTLYEFPHQHQNARSGVDWSETEATVVHEAVHQLAYNSGIHQRLFSHPLWCVEGLATMFEVRKLYDLNEGASQSEYQARNFQQLAALQEILASDDATANLVAQLVATDELFKRDAQTAYAGAWALTYYLAQRMPMQYRSLTQMQQKRGFGDYTTKQRIADFNQAIGLSPVMLAKRMRRFYLD